MCMRHYLHQSYRKKRCAGFTLIEMLVYVGIVSIVITIVIPFMFSVSRTYAKFRTEQVVVQNSKVALDTMIRDIKSGTGIYSPTSVFNANPGQLSLDTRITPPTDETSTYLDYYVDGGRLYRKAEGASAMPITSDRVTVSQFIVRRYNTTATSDFIQLVVTLVYNSQSQNPEFRVSRTFTTGAAIRGQY